MGELLTSDVEEKSKTDRLRDELRSEIEASRQKYNNFRSTITRHGVSRAQEMTEEGLSDCRDGNNQNEELETIARRFRGISKAIQEEMNGLISDADIDRYLEIRDKCDKRRNAQGEAVVIEQKDIDDYRAFIAKIDQVWQKVQTKEYNGEPITAKELASA